jgi:prepilin peptidase CpaA
MSDAVSYAACAALLVLSYTDLSARRLPNSLVAMFAALYVPHAWLAHTPWASCAQHAATALVCFAIGAALHAAGQFGGGDVKLASAVLLWAGPRAALPTLALVSLAGLVIVVLGCAVDRLAPSMPFAAPLARLWSARRGVAYGVALSIGGWCVVLPRELVAG